MDRDIAIQAQQLGKCYHIYNAPVDRLKQVFWRGRKRYFKEFWALNGLSIDIFKGETVGIVGSNGSGKSTLLQLICGVLTPTTGTLSVNGRIAALLELGAGFNPEFSGKDNIFMNAAILGLSREQTENCYDDIVRFADIGDFIEQPVKTYSSGMYVRLAFAIAINVSPDILLVDEALSVGDIRFQQKCIAKIKTFCETGTVVFVSHDLASIKELCSRAIWIDRGGIVMDGAPKFVAEQYAQYMYEGEIKNTRPVAGKTDIQEVPDYGANFVSIQDETRQFGNHDVRIQKWRMLSNGRFGGVVFSGKSCEIGVIVQAMRTVSNPIAGFLIKDKFGRVIIGDNTTVAGRTLPPLSENKKYHLAFHMPEWPNLCEGEYTLSFAIADGTLDNHVQCHWLNDIHTFRSIPAKATTGIFSLLETDVLVERYDG